jgi:hypothetical protein
MKYAIQGQRGALHRVSDTSPNNVPDNVTVVELTDAQADQVEAGINQTPRIFHALQDGSLITMQEKLEADRIANLSPEELAIHTAHAAALQAFESLSPGKQALWQSVKDKTEKLILAGDFAGVVGLLQTVPDLYEGIEVERQMFLELFN